MNGDAIAEWMIDFEASHSLFASFATKPEAEVLTLSKDVRTILFCVPAPRTGAVPNYSSQAQILEVRDEVPRNSQTVLVEFCPAGVDWVSFGMLLQKLPTSRFSLS
ncbi:hypothetical protein EPI10_020059 [Gossypium australe]|uniref:Uncharacterized protein n=1 Tax=Gossypium australe TaxID=47621 RepID=A0A5B6WCX6_9ROSI|nr:hypothetical protein EPI10_020059 [Gossypium australe]